MDAAQTMGTAGCRTSPAASSGHLCSGADPVVTETVVEQVMQALAICTN